MFMSVRKSKQDRAAQAAQTTTMEPPQQRFRWLSSSLLPFALGAVLTAGMFLQFSKIGKKR